MDDEEIILRGLDRILRLKYEVHRALHGQAGLEVLAAHSDIAVVMADYTMPGMDGVELLRQARVISPLSARLMLTAHGAAVSLRIAREKDLILEMLEKPFDPTHLMSTLDTAVAWHAERLRESY